MLGGNVIATLTRKGAPTKNAIGERMQAYAPYKTLTGWLDLMSGDSKFAQNAKLVESTHIFMCDYLDLDAEPDTCQMIIEGRTYDVQYIDDTMGLHQHLEIYLKYLGGRP